MANDDWRKLADQASREIDPEKLYDLVRSLSPKLENDRPLVGDIERVTALLQSEEAQKILGLDKNYEADGN